jgi:hypothetical protein
MFDYSGGTNWQILATADPDAEYLDAISCADPVPPPDYGGDASESCSGVPDEPWATWEPSGWVMNRLMVTGDAPVTADRCLDAIAGWERLIACAQAAQLREIARFAALRPGREPGTGMTLAADEIAVELQLTRVAANTRLALAQTLTDQLPTTLAALARGQIDLRKAQAVSEETWTLTDEQAQAVEARMLQRAAARDVSTISWWRGHPAPGGHPGRPCRSRPPPRAAQSRAASGAHPLPGGHGPAQRAVAGTRGTGDLRPVGCAGPAGKTTDDDRSIDQRRADCLTDLLLNDHSPGGTGGMRAQIRVTVAASNLLGSTSCPLNWPATAPSAPGKHASWPVRAHGGGCSPTRSAAPCWTTATAPTVPRRH